MKINLKKIIITLAVMLIGTVAFAKTPSLNKIDMKKWLYNAEDNVYYQLGLNYAATPKNKDYESMGLFIPGDYFNGKQNKDGTYSVKINKKAKVNGFTVKNAPYVIPIETPGYAAMNPPSEYSNSVKKYTDAGFIFVWAGARGREHGAPTGVTDFKAAIRYTRLNKSLLPGNTDYFFSFGMSGGGAQSALLGATGDSKLYMPYLKEIGAVMSESDAILGSMDWCPITNLDVADEAYEWNMGASRSNSDEFTQNLSDALATSFAKYVNKLGLKNHNGIVLTLEPSSEGIYQSGSYYEWTKAIVEESLNKFLSYTTFPYDSSAKSDGGMLLGGTGGMGRMPDGMANMPIEARDDIARKTASGTITISGTYATIQDYIDALNKAGKWVEYDTRTNTVKITSLADFSKALKVATKSVGAFDDLNASQGENTLFGYNDGKGAHFDSTMANILKGTQYEEVYATDLSKTDSVGNTVDVRLNMYNPMYYISDYYEGKGTSKIASYWRIRSGIFQGDTALNTEANLAQALKNIGKNVDFAAVWGLYHVKAEETGSSDTNFIEWVEEIVKGL